MKNDKKEAEKLTELLEKANNHPTMRSILAEEAAAVLEKRTEAAERIEDLQKERDEVIPKLQTALAEKEKKFNEAKAALDAASEEFQKAKYMLATERHQFENSMNREKAILFETAPPEIDKAVAFFTAKLAFLRSPGRIHHNTIGAKLNLISWKKTAKGETNVAAVNGALSYCQSAIKELQKMKLVPALDMEKIEKMKAGIPDIGIYIETTGEKPMPRVNTGPFTGMASDSELDWRRDKLMEKAKKVLRS